MSGARARRRASRGVFLTFEGVEGSGKTTQIGLLAKSLKAAGVDTVVTHEPGGTRFGARVRRLLLDPRTPAPVPEAELLLYVADRAQHLREVIVPALERGVVVLCDRYLDATLAYQGAGRGVEAKHILELHRRPPLDLRPDRTILLDHDPGIALPRARLRNANIGTDRSEGRMESEALTFHRKVRRGYRALASAEPARFRVIAARGSIAEIERSVRVALADLLPGLA